MNIGILTSGGDAPGMNAFISNFVKTALKNKYNVFAFKFGFQGIIDNDILNLTSKETDNISHLGGSFIKSFRSPEFQTEKGFSKALINLKKNKIDCLIVLGGDGSLKGVEKLEKNEVKTLFIPATIDNDISYTDRSLGFDSAVNCAVEQIDKIRQTMLSLNRIFICEVMGRNCSDIAKSCALATNANVLIAEEKDNNLSKIISKIKTALKDGEEAPLIVARENILNTYELARNLQNHFDIETRTNILGYVQRGTSPSVFDRIYARQLSDFSIDLIKKEKFNLALGLINNNVSCTKIATASSENNKKSLKI